MYLSPSLFGMKWKAYILAVVALCLVWPFQEAFGMACYAWHVSRRVSLFYGSIAAGITVVAYLLCWWGDRELKA